MAPPRSGNSLIPDDLLLNIARLSHETASAGAKWMSANVLADNFTSLTNVDVAGATNLDSATAGVLKPSTLGIDSLAKVVLHMNGTNGSTTFTDSSLVPKTVTPTAATISTAQNKFGGACGVFNGSSSVISIASDIDFAFPTATDFTVEGFVYFNNVTGNQVVFQVAVSSGFELGKTSGGNLYMARNGVAVDASAAWSPTVSTWYHIAYSRQGSTGRLFANGALLATITDNTSYPQGAATWGGLSGNWLNAYLDEWRITKGTSRYNAAFTAPTAAFATGNNNLTVVSTAIALVDASGAAKVPKSIRGVLVFKEVDAGAASTDYTIRLSRDGGTSWTSAVLTESHTDELGRRWCTFPFTSVTSQPSGSSFKWEFATATGKLIEFRGVARMEFQT